MSEQQKNSSRPVKSATTVSEANQKRLSKPLRSGEAAIDLPSLIIGKMIRYVIIPCLLFYGNHLLENLTNEMKSSSKSQSELSIKLDVQQANIEKRLEIMEYRLSVLEASYGKIHTKLFGE